MIAGSLGCLHKKSGSPTNKIDMKGNSYCSQCFIFVVRTYTSDDNLMAIDGGRALIDQLLPDLKLVKDNKTELFSQRPAHVRHRAILNRRHGNIFRKYKYCILARSDVLYHGSKPPPMADLSGPKKSRDAPCYSRNPFHFLSLPAQKLNGIQKKNYIQNLFCLLLKTYTLDDNSLTTESGKALLYQLPPSFFFVKDDEAKWFGIVRLITWLDHIGHWAML